MARLYLLAMRCAWLGGGGIGGWLSAAGLRKFQLAPDAVAVIEEDVKVLRETLAQCLMDVCTADRGSNMPVRSKSDATKEHQRAASLARKEWKTLSELATLGESLMLLRGGNADCDSDAEVDEEELLLTVKDTMEAAHRIEGGLTPHGG